MPQTVLVTGGAGFIGSAVVRFLMRHTTAQVVNIDKLTYAACPSSLRSIADDPRYTFIEGDVACATTVQSVFSDHQPDAVIHLAAESHVDRSIDGPDAFISTNIHGTYTLLQAALAYFRAIPAGQQERFRFLHVSTDEVYGSLGPEGRFTEDSPVRPNSPYSASKASADHLVRAWNRTYGLPTIITNCSNNYGPHQFPEKLVPTIILRAIRGQSLPIYGSGQQVRDWLHVDDHATALWTVVTKGRPGREYLIGGESERTNLDVVHAICSLLDERLPDGAPHSQHIQHVADRPGHDERYAIDPGRIQKELGWHATHNFESGLAQTVDWFLQNRSWWQPLVEKGASDRIGLGQ
ncbi:MAG: dTDP-glucose 4,6-dehydratase [Deltaproteobacteria bacterium]|nr:dTDP-glucose 4,6-dehydratase [Deltaproteobacteria bacterium]